MVAINKLLLTEAFQLSSGQEVCPFQGRRSAEGPARPTGTLKQRQNKKIDRLGQEITIRSWTKDRPVYREPDS